MRIVHVDLRRGAIYLHPYSQTTEGAWIAAPPFVRFERDDPDLRGKLNETVPKLLRESRNGVPHPTDWNVVGRELYRLAGVKSWRGFVTGGCLSLRIEDREDGVYLVPQENRGAKGGFVDCAEPISCSSIEMSDWKGLLTKAFALCK